MLIARKTGLNPWRQKGGIEYSHKRPLTTSRTYRSRIQKTNMKILLSDV